MLPVTMMKLFFIQPKQAVSFKENTKFIYPFKGDVLSPSIWITLSHWILYLNYWDTTRLSLIFSGTFYVTTGRETGEGS